jgi:hypothetical protein
MGASRLGRAAISSGLKRYCISVANTRGAAEQARTSASAIVKDWFGIAVTLYQPNDFHEMVVVSEASEGSMPLGVGLGAGVVAMQIKTSDTPAFLAIPLAV